MFCASVVAWDISLPPTTPRGTSRSAPGLTTFMAPPTWRRVYRRSCSWPAGAGTSIWSGPGSHLNHPWLTGQRARDLVGIQAGGGGFHEHPSGGLQQGVRGVEHERRDQQRGDGVGPVEPGGEDHHRGDRGGDEAV